MLGRAKYLIIFFIPVLSWSLTQVRIAEVSSTKNSVVLAYGALDGVKIGDRGFFLKTTNKELIQKDFVGEAQVVKVFDRYSVWYFTKTKNPNYLVVDSTLDLMLSKNLQAGKAPFKIVKKQTVKKDGNKTEITYKEDDYIQGEVIRPAQEREDFDVQIYELDKWVKSQDFQDRFESRKSNVYRVHKSMGVIDPKKVIEAGEMREQIDATVALLDKTNKEGFSIDKFYSEQEKAEIHKEFLKDGTLEKSSGGLASKKLRDRKKRRELIQNLKKKGLDWSEDYDDEQLVDLVNRFGLYKELKRQEYALNQVISSQLNFYLNTNLSETSDNAKAPPEEVTSNPLRFGAGYEYFWYRQSDELKKLTTEFGFYAGYNNYDLNGLVKTNEEYINILGRWYLLQGPATVDRALPFLALGIKLGRASAKVYGNTFKYDMLSTLVQAGIQYRMKVNYGARFAVTYDSGELTQFSGLRDETINSTITASYFDASFALSYYF